MEDVTGRQLEAAERTEDALAVYWCKYHGVTEGRKKGRKEDRRGLAVYWCKYHGVTVCVVCSSVSNGVIEGRKEGMEEEGHVYWCR